MRPFDPKNLIDVLVGSRRESSPQYAVLGDLVPDTAKTTGASAGAPARERRVGLDHNSPSSILIAGLQGAGKSYTLTNIVHGFLQPIPGMNALPNPGCAVFIHYHKLPTYAPEVLTVLRKNSDPGQVDMLSKWGGTPTAMPADKVTVLCPPGMEGQRSADFPGVTVVPLRFRLQDLTIEQRQVFLGCDSTAKQSVAVDYLNELLRQHREAGSLAPIRAGIESSEAPLSATDRAEIRFRLTMLERFIASDTGFTGFLRPGSLVVCDLRDPFINKLLIQKLIIVLLQQIGAAEVGCPKMAVIDEAHAITGDPQLDIALTDQARLMRHTGTTMVLASQSMKDLPADLIELSNIIIAHRYDSPRWHAHLRSVKGAYEQVPLGDQMTLELGQAFFWSSRTTEPAIRKNPCKIKIRPSACAPGGETIFATGAAT